MAPIRIVLADDHRIVLEGLAQLLALESDFDVIARCTDGRTALDEVERNDPDLLVVDVKMPGMSGLDVLRAITEARRRTRVVLLTAHITDAEVLEAVRLGAGGIVLKEAASRTLVQCARTVAEGGRWLDQRTIHGALDSMLRREAGLEKVTRVLTRREIEIVRLAAAGLRNRAIAEKLSISEGTVKMHLHSIYDKLGVSGRVELGIYARENALL